MRYLTNFSQLTIKSFRFTKFPVLFSFFFFLSPTVHSFPPFAISSPLVLQRNSINSRKSPSYVRNYTRVCNWYLSTRVFFNFTSPFAPLFHNAAKMTIGSSSSVRLGFEDLLDTRRERSQPLDYEIPRAVSDQAKDAWISIVRTTKKYIVLSAWMAHIRVSAC